MNDKLKGLKEAYVIARKKKGMPFYVDQVNGCKTGSLEPYYGNLNNRSFKWTDNLTQAKVFIEAPKKELLPSASRVVVVSVKKSYVVSRKWNDIEDKFSGDLYIELRYCLQKYSWHSYTKKEAIEKRKDSIQKEIDIHNRELKILEKKLKLVEKL